MSELLFIFSLLDLIKLRIYLENITIQTYRNQGYACYKFRKKDSDLSDLSSACYKCQKYCGREKCPCGKCMEVLVSSYSKQIDR